MRTVAIAILLAGLAFMTLGYSHELRQEQVPPTKVEIRYVPRTFEEEQVNLPRPSELFRSMFEDRPISL